MLALGAGNAGKVKLSPAALRILNTHGDVCRQMVVQVRIEGAWEGGGGQAPGNERRNRFECQVSDSVKDDSRARPIAARGET